MKKLLPFLLLVLIAAGCKKKEGPNALSNRLPGKTWKYYLFTSRVKHRPVYLFFEFDETEDYHEYQGFSRKEITSNFAEGDYLIDGSVLTLKNKEKTFNYIGSIKDSTLTLRVLNPSRNNARQVLIFTESN